MTMRQCDKRCQFFLSYSETKMTNWITGCQTYDYLWEKSAQRRIWVGKTKELATTKKVRNKTTKGVTRKITF